MDLLRTLCLLDIIYDPLICDGTESAQTPYAKYLGYDSSIDWSLIYKIIAMFEHIAAARRGIFRRKSLDIFDSSDHVNLLDFECSYSDSDLLKAKKVFCDTCGICKAIRTVRKIIHYLSLNTPKHMMGPIAEGCNLDQGCVSGTEVYIIQHILKACPTLCDEDAIRVSGPSKSTAPIGNSSRPYEYVIRIPRAYKCAKRRSIDTLCFDIHDLWAPTTAVCFYNDGIVNQGNIFSERYSFTVLNEDD